MAGKRDWLDAGLVLLAEQGAPAVTIERLTERLGLSKGSFYHHFKGITGYRAALLEHFEAERTTRFVEQAEAAGDDRLGALLKLVLAPGSGLALEIAVRAWALQDGGARAVQERVDRTRVAYLAEISGDAGLAQALYLVVVGAGQVVPPLTGRQLKSALELVLGRRT
ncbi:TetR/AcrR family transcriptional regulator [Amycolatopsis sp. CA-128772]|uniref:TetR/AcrR family transcriptional regulator n=1 Tax=Amycolatopsis sp. CA-128772 TaxID=2073159 RepID=UPI001E3954A9|nr:TetR/AcrR family transcriptional regulator [Amycolatopsis sp. CA-128772]